MTDDKGDDLTFLIQQLRSYRPYRIGDGEWFGPRVCEEAADKLSALKERVEAADKALYDGLVKASGARGLRISRLTDAIEAARAHLLNPERDNG